MKGNTLTGQLGNAFPPPSPKMGPLVFLLMDGTWGQECMGSPRGGRTPLNMGGVKGQKPGKNIGKSIKKIQNKAQTAHSFKLFDMFDIFLTF